MKTIWGDDCRSLLDAAQRSRRDDLIESPGSELTTDECDSGGYLRHRLSANREDTRSPQLSLWSAA